MTYDHHPLANPGTAFYHWIESMDIVINFRRVSKQAHPFVDSRAALPRKSRPTAKPRMYARLFWVRSFYSVKRSAQNCTKLHSVRLHHPTHRLRGGLKTAHDERFCQSEVI